jgi:hypothetical protein
VDEADGDSECVADGDKDALDDGLATPVVSGDSDVDGVPVIPCVADSDPVADDETDDVFDAAAVAVSMADADGEPEDVGDPVPPARDGEPVDEDEKVATEALCRALAVAVTVGVVDTELVIVLGGVPDPVAEPDETAEADGRAEFVPHADADGEPDVAGESE